MWTKRKIRNYLYRLYTFYYGCFHKVEKKILFDSFYGKQYSDNPRAISEKLHELYPEYKIVWKLNKMNDKYKIVPEYVKKVSNSKDFYKELATSFCYITNEGMEPNKYKRKNQIFIQTWHGDRGFKKALYTYWEDQKQKRPIPIIDNKITDFCVAGSDYGEMFYREGFRYKGKVLKIGTPRNDKLVKQDYEEYKKIKELLNIPIDTKIILYAPTFCDNEKNEQETLVDLRKIVNILNKKGENWICLTRAHSAVKKLKMDKAEKIIDLTDYPDMADLLLISDILITDYSSCSGDFILLNKLVILAIFDDEKYEQECREMYFPISDSGYIIAHNQKELENIIEKKDEINIKENCELVKEFYGTNETGESAEKICKMIKEFELKQKEW